LGEDGEGDVAVPADEAAAFEVVDAETGFEFAVVVFDPVLVDNSAGGVELGFMRRLGTR